MSSRQLSTEPMGHRCPSCGAEIRDPRRRYCWLCDEDLAPRDGITAQPPPLPRLRLPGHASGDAPVMAVFGVLALLLGLGLLAEGPGALILLLILATPALVRTVVTTVRKDRESAPASAGVVLGTFLSSVGVVAIVGLASVVAFYATCFVVCLGGLAVANLKGGGEGLILVASVGAGLVPGLIVAVVLFRAFWRRKAS